MPVDPSPKAQAKRRAARGIAEVLQQQVDADDPLLYYCEESGECSTSCPKCRMVRDAVKAMIEQIKRIGAGQAENVG